MGTTHLPDWQRITDGCRRGACDALAPTRRSPSWAHRGGDVNVVKDTCISLVGQACPAHRLVGGISPRYCAAYGLGGPSGGPKGWRAAVAVCWKVAGDRVRAGKLCLRYRVRHRSPRVKRARSLRDANSPHALNGKSPHVISWQVQETVLDSCPASPLPRHRTMSWTSPLRATPDARPPRSRCTTGTEYGRTRARYGGPGAVW